MAEFVQLRSERTISELEQMKRIELFTAEEVRMIATKRKRYEYKRERRVKSKDTYLRYIQYELDLLRLISLRRKKTGIFSKRAEIEHSITSRVNSLFHQALIRYSSDIKLWMSQIKFCQSFSFKSTISGILVRLLSRHSDKAKVWKFAAYWEFNHNESIENARKYLLRGLRFHPKSKLLHKVFFQIEIEHAIIQTRTEKEKDLLENELQLAEMELESQEADESTANKIKTEMLLKKENSKKKEHILETKFAEIVFESALQKFADVQYLIDFVRIVQKFKVIRNKILNQLEQNFPNEELVYDLKAKLALGNDPTPEACLLAYSEAVVTLPTERMWSFYLDMLDSCKKSSSKKKQLENELEKCHTKGLLNERFYPKLIRRQSSQNKKITLLQEALGRFPRNAKLHKLYVDAQLMNCNEGDALSAFDAAMTNLGKDSLEMLPLYMSVIQHFEQSNFDLADKFFKRCLVAGPNISTGLKPCYLLWIYEKRGLDAARAEYKTMSLIPPLCLKLHTKMIKLELDQPEVNVKNVRSCYDLACHHFGENNPDLWMMFIAFETNSGNPKLVSSVYSRAKARLSADRLDEFITKFTTKRSRAQ